MGMLCEEGRPPWPPPRLRYLSPGSSILSIGLQSFWRDPSKSVGARMVFRDGKPEWDIDFERIEVALSSSGEVNSQCMYSTVEEARYGYRNMSTGGGAVACEIVKCVRFWICENIRAKTGREFRDNEIRDSDFSFSVLECEEKYEIPSSVNPWRFSRRKDFRDGSNINVSSLKDVVGNDETCKFSSEGSELKTSVNSGEFIIPSGLQCMTNV